jgi:hypothetical protein
MSLGVIDHDPETWSVEARQGVAEGRSKRFPAASNDDAQQIACQLMATDERWREMP